MTNILYDALVLGRQSGNGELFAGDDGSVVMTDQVFFDLVERIATLLLDKGVLPGDRVAAQVPKCIEALALYLACVRAGAVFLPLNTAYTEAELAYFVNDASPSVLVMDTQRESMGARLTDAQGVLTLNADTGADASEGARGTLLEQAHQIVDVADVVARSESDLAAILYTSGTTGRSKGAMLDHANLLSNAQTLTESWRFTSDDVLLHALPIFHTHGLFVASNIVLLSGARMIFQPGFATDQVVQALPAATSMMGVPTFYTRLLADDRFTRELVEHMRLFVSGSAPLLADTHREFEQRTGQRILERYGMTETNMTTSNPYDGERIAGTVGLALKDVELRICDADNHDVLATGQVGVLHVRGPNVFAGYWQMPEKTREELLPDGFFITGDLATIDDNGYVTIVGRSRDLIISGGYNIYPKEIELLIDELPGVSESAVIGVPHRDFGEGVVALVVADGSRDETELTESWIVAQLADSVARFKQPKRVIVVDELPRNTMGKVQKNVLREQYHKLFA